KRAYCLKTQPATGETYPKSDLFNKATALRNSPGPLTLRDAKKIAAKCNEKYKQLNALNAMSK
ncbi:hypothetical protein EGK01_28785, partial [Klebsiella pneumoniae]